MAEMLFRCNICKDGKIYTSVEAEKHKEETGHNDWVENNEPCVEQEI